MELHNNARSCPASRGPLVRRILGGMSVTGATESVGVSKQTAFKWKRRLLRGRRGGPRRSQFPVAWFQASGIQVESVMSDNGSCYVSHRFKITCQKLKLRHLRTKPYRPKTNGKAERFIQTLLREWAYRRPYSTSAQRADRLPRYLNHHNLRRPHAALNKRTPAQRLSEQPLENGDTEASASPHRVSLDGGVVR